MTYLYEIVSTGKEIEVEQGIKDEPHEVLEIDGEIHPVRRLINTKGGFQLKGERWAKDGYSYWQNN